MFPGRTLELLVWEGDYGQLCQGLWCSTSLTPASAPKMGMEIKSAAHLPHHWNRIHLTGFACLGQGPSLLTSLTVLCHGPKRWPLSYGTTLFGQRANQGLNPSKWALKTHLWENAGGYSPSRCGCQLGDPLRPKWEIPFKKNPNTYMSTLLRTDFFPHPL